MIRTGGVRIKSTLICSQVWCPVGEGPFTPTQIVSWDYRIVNQRS
jgi:hypothetical protein